MLGLEPEEDEVQVENEEEMVVDNGGETVEDGPLLEEVE